MGSSFVSTQAQDCEKTVSASLWTSIVWKQRYLKVEFVRMCTFSTGLRNPTCQSDICMGAD